MNNILMVLWALGNLIIFSTVIYLKWTISGTSFDTIFLSLIMVAWVFGQFNLIKEKE